MYRKTAIEVGLLALAVALLTSFLAGQVVAQGQGQMPEEIEVAPDVWVPCDLWDDAYVPTCQDLTDAGFLEPDAVIIASQQCSWSEIKACFMGYYNNCCPKKAEG